jgi:hypothetical protein
MAIFASRTRSKTAASACAVLRSSASAASNFSSALRARAEIAVSFHAAGHYPVESPLRRGDEFQEFYDLLHRVVSLLKARENEDVLRLEQALSALQGLAPASNESARKALESLRAMRDRKRRTTSSSPGIKAAPGARSGEPGLGEAQPGSPPPGNPSADPAPRNAAPVEAAAPADGKR